MRVYICADTDYLLQKDLRFSCNVNQEKIFKLNKNFVRIFFPVFLQIQKDQKIAISSKLKALEASNVQPRLVVFSELRIKKYFFYYIANLP